MYLNLITENSHLLKAFNQLKLLYIVFSFTYFLTCSFSVYIHIYDGYTYMLYIILYHSCQQNITHLQTGDKLVCKQAFLLNKWKVVCFCVVFVSLLLTELWIQVYNKSWFERCLCLQSPNLIGGKFFGARIIPNDFKVTRPKATYGPLLIHVY